MEIRKPRSQSTTSGTRKKPISKIAEKRVRRNKKRGILFLCLSIVLFVFVILLLRSEKFFIKNIDVSGARPEYNSSLKVHIEEYLDGSVLLVLPRRNIILFGEHHLREYLLTKNTYLESITFTRQGLDGLSVQAKERAPYFFVEQEGEEQNVFIDSYGVVYRDAAVILSTTTIRLKETSSAYGASTTGALPVGFSDQVGKPLPEVYFKNLIRAIELFKAKNFTIQGVTLRPYGDADIQITPEGGVLRINLYDDIDKTVATFSAARKIETLRSKLSERRSSLQYIDLRFGNKVFYMFTAEAI